MTINFVSSKHSDVIRTMHAKSVNTDILMGKETNEIIEEHFESLLQKYQEWLEENMRGSKFVFHSVNLLECKLNKIDPGRAGSYIDSRE